MDQSLPKPPRAARKSHVTSHHGIERDDPYFWLRADNWQEVMQSPEALDGEIRTYLEAENAWFEAGFGNRAEDLKERIFKEIRGRIKEDDSSIPTPDGPFAYFSRMLEGKQYPLIVRTPREGGEETILIDCNAEAEGTEYFGFGGGAHSPDHRLMAWSVDRNGSEYYTLVVRDLQTGKELADRIERTAGGGVWAPDSKTIYYTELDDMHRPYRVLRHRLGTPQSEDEIVYEEKDAGFFVGVGNTLSRRFIVISAHDHQTSETYLIDAENPGAPRLIAPRQTGREYGVDERNGLLYIHTNADGAEDFKIATAPVDNPGPENWTDLVPHRQGVLITATIVISGHLIRLKAATRSGAWRPSRLSG